MDQRADVEVVIVGMGPTGVALAGLLGLRGVSVSIFDKAPSLHPLPRAIGMDHEVMRIAQELGIADDLQEHVVPYRPSEYHGVDGDVIKRLDSPPPPYRTGWAPMFAFDQPSFELMLRRRLEELPTVTAETSTEVLAVGEDDAGAWVDVRRATSATLERVRTAYVVACDGGASPIRESLGIGLLDLGFHESWLVVDVIVDDDETLARLPQTQVQFCEPERPATFVHLLGRHRRWEIALHDDELPIGPVDNDLVWPWLRRWIEPGQATIWRAAAYRFHGLVAEQWRRGRILLAGDAVHMTPPFMAQGMAQGMRDAQNLAWKLTAVLREEAGPRLLETYETERRTHVTTTTRNTIELGRVISERDPELARRRDRELLEPHGGNVPVTMRANFLPTLTSGLVDESAPGAGEIMPQPFVHTGSGLALLDDVVGNGFLVVVDHPLTAEDLTRLGSALAPVQGRVVTLLADADPHDAPTGSLVECDRVFATWLDSLGANAAIVRPDRYVYGTARSLVDLHERLGALIDRLGSGESVIQPTK